MEYIEGYQHSRAKRFDGVRIMPVHMVRLPAIDRFVQTVVLDDRQHPASAAQSNHRFSAGWRWRKIGLSYHFAGFSWELSSTLQVSCERTTSMGRVTCSQVVR
jgi:hypothetical protein